MVIWQRRRQLLKRYNKESIIYFILSLLWLFALTVLSLLVPTDSATQNTVYQIIQFRFSMEALVWIEWISFSFQNNSLSIFTKVHYRDVDNIPGGHLKPVIFSSCPPLLNSVGQRKDIDTTFVFIESVRSEWTI